MSIKELIQTLAPGALIEMFELDITSITGTNLSSDFYYFHDGSSAANTSIVWKTKTYERFPIEADGFDKSLKGTLPRPRLRVSNVTGIITALLMGKDDLVGAKVTRRRTYAKYLDGQPGADPTQALPDDVFYIDRKVSHNKRMVEWELASALDLQGVQLPFRVIAANFCPWTYKSAECSYIGASYWNALDVSVVTAALDVCSKSVAGCKLRFSAGSLPFGGFPAVRVYK